MYIHNYLFLLTHMILVLMEHKVQSTVLQSDLSKIIKLKESAQDEQKAVMTSLAQLEGSVKEVERQMRELGKVSAIQDGRVNVAHAKVYIIDFLIIINY